jgi:hypothetical protein
MLWHWSISPVICFMGVDSIRNGYCSEGFDPIKMLKKFLMALHRAKNMIVLLKEPQHALKFSYDFRAAHKTERTARAANHQSNQIERASSLGAFDGVVTGQKRFAFALPKHHSAKMGIGATQFTGRALPSWTALVRAFCIGFSACHTM